MLLTQKQEKYVRGLVAGLSQREAYKQAYNAKNMKDTTIDVRASKLLAEYKVNARYRELIEEHKTKSLFTRQEAVNELIWLYKQSKKSIEEQDEGYVRQGTSGAMLGALDRLIALELLDPINQMQHEKIKQETKIMETKAESNESDNAGVDLIIVDAWSDEDEEIFTED